MSDEAVQRPPKRVDMKEVAAAAGVSTATVSRVLSQSGYASPATRARVTEVADRLGYQPDSVARGLRTRRSTTLAILVPDLRNPVTLAFIRGVQHVAQQCGYAVVIADAQRDAEVERRQLALFQSQRVAAVIVAGMMQDPSALSTIARGNSLLVHSPDAAPGSLEGEREAITDAVSDLSRHRHRSVLFISRRAPSANAEPPATLTEVRRRALADASAELGMRADQCTLPTELSGAAASGRLADALGGPGGPRAIICASHRLAPQVLAMLATMGWDIPGQISFLTFGDSEWATAYRPALSVIRLNRYQEARHLTRELLVQLGNVLPLEEAAALPAYVPRDSVGDRPDEAA